MGAPERPRNATPLWERDAKVMSSDSPEELSPASASALAAALGPRTGRVIGGRYKLVAPLAEGGMGSVWRAEHETLGLAVAVKFLAGGSANNPEHRARFDREARVAARIAEDTRHVVKVTDHGVEEDGTPWLVMELLQGEGLDRRLRRESRLPLPLVVDLVRQIARGLEVAHRLLVVHRDLKPANVFLCADLAVDEAARNGGKEEIFAKVLDFGVAKSLWDDDAPTREGVVLGTVGYMSPEQLTGDGDVDARTDVWALGAIAYRALVGRPAFGTGTSQEIAARVQSVDPPAPSQLVAGLPREVDEVIARALDKDARKRFPSALELAEAFARAASAVAEAESSQPPVAAEMQSTGDVVVAAAPQPPPPARPSHRRAAIVALLSIAALVALFFVTVRRVSVPEPTPASSPRALSPAARIASVPSASASAPSTASASASNEAAPAAVSVVPSSSATSGAPKGKLPKVIDTWKKKDEL